MLQAEPETIRAVH